MKQVSAVITDLDNTLYDWVEMWYQSFSAMLRCLVVESGIDQATLEAEIRTVFQKHGTSEYAFLIEELPSLKTLHPNEDLTEVYSSAIEAYRLARHKTRHLYPTVLETLQQLKNQGCLVVAYTESRSYYTLRRVKTLGLDGLLDYLYSTPDHATPDSVDRWYDQDAYQLSYTVQKFTEEGEHKPNPHILSEIISTVEANPEETIYIGDSLMKDIYMAQQANITDVFAAYGTAQYREAYELLRRVSHWSKADVEREKETYGNMNIKPSYILKENFGEILDIFKFTPHKNSKK